MLDYITATIDIVILFAVIGISYYSVMLIFQMRKGSLEKSWKFMAFGALIAIVGTIMLVIQDFSGGNTSLTGHLALGLAGSGSVFIMLGFREHYLFWNPKQLKRQEAQSKKDFAEAFK